MTTMMSPTEITRAARKNSKAAKTETARAAWALVAKEAGAWGRASMMRAEYMQEVVGEAIAAANRASRDAGETPPVAVVAEWRGAPAR